MSMGSGMRKARSFNRRQWWKTGVPATMYHQHTRGDVVCSDALDFLGSLRERSADLVFLDPPFNLGKRYGANHRNGDRLPSDAYCRYIEQVLLRSCDVLKDGGALYLYHIPRYAMLFGSHLQDHLDFRHWIAISMKNGFVRGERLYPAHYALLYFTKGDPSVFSRPKLAPPCCRNCGKVLKDYGGYKRFVIDGVNLSDYWDDISPVRHRKYKNRGANELPPAILDPKQA